MTQARYENVSFAEKSSIRQPKLSLSPGQQDLWLENQLYADDSYNHFQFVAKLSQTLNIFALRGAIKSLTRRHESLRTIFPETDQGPIRKIVSPAHITLEQKNCSSLPENKIKQIIQEDFSLPFNLQKDAPCRFIIYQKSENEYFIQIIAHHIAFSLEGYVLLPVELAKFYTSELDQRLDARLPIQFVTYSDFVERYSEMQRAPEYATHKHYWSQQTLRQPLPSPELPLIGEPQPSSTFEGSLLKIRLDHSLISIVKDLAKSQSCSTFAALTTAFQILISRYTQHNETIVGIPTDLKKCFVNTLAFRDLVGFTTNTLPLRSLIRNDETFLETLRRVSDDIQGLSEHRAYPLGKIRTDSSSQGLSNNLFSTLVISQKTKRFRELLSFGIGENGIPLEIGSLRYLSVGLGHLPVGRFDLALAIVQTHQGFELVLHYNKLRYERHHIERLLDNFLQLLRSVTLEPNKAIGQLNLLSEKERKLQLSDWISPHNEGTIPSFLERFEACCERFPNNTAVSCGGSNYDYTTLNVLSNQLCNYLKSIGLTRTSLVAVSLSRSLDLVTSLLAVMKSGCPYLPLDPDYPPARLSFMLNDSGADFLVTEREQAARYSQYPGKIIYLDEISNHLNRQLTNISTPDYDSNRLAYIIYTSGSTGQPKGVEITESALSNLLWSLKTRLDIQHTDRWLALTTISFDISALEIFLPLSVGASVEIISRDVAVDPKLLAQCLDEARGITYAQATPATWKMLIDDDWVGNHRLTVLSGGESLSSDLAQTLLARSRRVWNMYGPTETTIWSSMALIDNTEQVVTIGRPIDNTEFYILGHSLLTVPVGVAGELYIGGKGLARGYKNHPELTQSRFVTHPTLGKRLYRTGDRVRYLDDGRIEYLGRFDDQIKIRGHRIEPKEIALQIMKCPNIDQAFVTVREDNPGQKQLVGYYKGPDEPQDVRQFLASSLPQYMMPSALVKMETFALTPNGKIDRSALPAPNYQSPDSTASTPKNHTEKEILSVFQEVLNSKSVTVTDNFFFAGGDSLLAAKAIRMINRRCQTNLPLKSLFDYATVRALSEKILDESCHNHQKSLNSGKLHGARPSRGLSSFQEGVWFLEHLVNDSRVYSIPFAVELRGNVDVKAIRRALQLIVSRHEILRTVFVQDENGPVSHVLPVLDMHVPLTSFINSTNPKKRLQEAIETELDKPFDLSNGPLFRCHVFQETNHCHWLVFNFHHLIFDGSSTEIFLSELSDLYEFCLGDLSRALPQIKMQYSNYVRWQQQAEQQAQNDKQVGWWVEKLKGIPPLLDLPTDRIRPQVQTYRGRTIEFAIPPNDVEQLEQFSKHQHTSIFVTLLAAFQVLIYRYSSQEDFGIGIPISDRTHPDFGSLIGPSLNTICLRTQLSATIPFSKFLTQVKRELYEALGNKDAPFEHVVKALKAPRSPQHSPLFQVMFNMLPPSSMPNIGTAETRVIQLDRGRSHFDISLSIQRTDSKIHGFFEFNSDLFDCETIQRMSEHYCNLIRIINSHPSQPIDSMQILSEEEIRKQSIDWNQQSVSYSAPTTVVSCIQDVAISSPQSTALVWDDRSWTYEELNAKANKVAHKLLSDGINREDKVVVSVGRSAEFIIAILGVLKAGGAYVPVDPNEPRNRLNTILDELKPFCMLTEKSPTQPIQSCPVLLMDDCSSSPLHNPDVQLTSDQLAYIIYTSGSTGQPKGVEIEHGSIADRVAWKNSCYPLSSNDGLLHTYSFIFDGSIINYFWPLCTGATLVITTSIQQYDISSLVHLISKYQITAVDLLPTLLDGLLQSDEIAGCISLKHVFSGGEALPSRIVHDFYLKLQHATLYNTYGPTEATVEASVWKCDPAFEGPIAPIGRPIAGAKLYVLDPNKNIAPVGVAGELYIGGVGLARGYVNDLGKTSEKFLTVPVSKSSPIRLYRTGDLVRYLPNGDIEFLGRIDDQIKLRGYRIEKGEIEAQIKKMGAVEHAIVVVRGSDVHKRLISYVVLKKGSSSNIFYSQMISFLADKLPKYMIPDQVVCLDIIPTLPNGKTDLKSLPTPPIQPSKKILCPIERSKMTPEEQLLVSIWSKVLPNIDIDPQDDFFDIGGNSLLAIQLLTKIKKETGVSISPIQLFENPTVAALSRLVSSAPNQARMNPIVLMNATGGKRPFFLIHPIGGGILCYSALAKAWTKDRPLYAIQSPTYGTKNSPNESVTTMASEYISYIQEIQPKGPYHIGGWSFGGLIAAEIVAQLEEAGEEVACLVLIDTTAEIEHFQSVPNDELSILSEIASQYAVSLPHMGNDSASTQLASIIEHGIDMPDANTINTSTQIIGQAKANYRALKAFTLTRINAQVVLIRSDDTPSSKNDLGWNAYANKITVQNAPGNHWAITQSSHAPRYSELIEASLNRSDNMFAGSC